MIQDYKNITIILTTHSPYVISELKEYFLNIRNLELDKKTVNISEKLSKKNVINTFKSIYKISFSKDSKDDDNKIISKIASMINFDFSRMFFSDKIIAVEGMSDYFVFTFPTIFSVLKKGLGDFEVIPFYGLSNLSLAYTIFEVFNKKFIFICDNDAKVKPKNTDFIKQIENLKNKYDKIEILEKGELEDELNIKPKAKSRHNNEKSAIIIDKKEEIDTNENAKILLKYLNKLKLNNENNIINDE